MHLVGHLYYSPILTIHGQTQIKLTLRFFSHFIWDWYTGMCNNSYFIIQGAASEPVIKLTTKKKKTKQTKQNKTKTTLHSAVKVDTIYFNIVFGF